MPYQVVWVTFEALGSLDARDALWTARAIGLALGGKGAQRHVDRAIDDAFPEAAR